ncbi:MAG: alpha/beta hydrolase [Oleiphilaceae bacterium]|nr:alpha/beta hydrolase [Oleiphilaceae bacterium]
MKEALFFGPENLFGLYYPSLNATSGRLAVICPPLFDEYQRTYKALGDLAEALAHQGMHVMRFDYRGTGESFGELESVSAYQAWCADIEAAIDEGVALSGARDIHLIGVRLGATLAATVNRSDIVSRIFWDVLPSGECFLKYLKSVDLWLAQSLAQTAVYTGGRATPGAQHMFQCSELLEQSLADLSLKEQRVENAYSLQSRGYVIHETLPFKETIALDFEYNWPPFESGLLRPRRVQECILSLLR